MDILTGLVLAGALQVTTPQAAPEAPAAPVAAAPLNLAATASARADGALDAAELEGLRGGDGNVAVAITDQTLTAVNAGNSVNGQTISSGQINVGADAFGGFSGIGNFAINSGHNNNLQSTVSVTVNITQPLP
jgi:hypothetical protein